MDDQPYPNAKRGAKAGLICGSIAAAAWFAFCCCVAARPAVTPVSLSLAFRPWWRVTNWLSAFGVFVVTCLTVGPLVALRPAARDPSDDRRSTT